MHRGVNVQPDRVLDSRVPALPVKEKEVEIHLHVPAIRLPSKEQVRTVARASMSFVRKRRRLLLPAIAVVLVAGAVYGWREAHTESRVAKDSTGARNLTDASVMNQTPDFSTVLPKGRTIEDLGGWGRISPPDKDAVYAYSDMMGGAHIVVSQQLLPADFKADLSAKISQVARQFSASKKVPGVTGPAAYVGTATNGAQSVVTSKNDLLILIRSNAVIGDQAWADYIQSLE